MKPAEIMAEAERLKAVRARLKAEADAKAAEKKRLDDERVAVAQSQLFPEYVDDPVGFATNILGLRMWRKQEEILRAVAAGRRVSVVSGQKTGKSTVLAILALWWVKTRRQGRVIATAVRDVSIREIFWREFRRFYFAAKTPIGGEIHLTALHGLRFKDDRQVIGFTAKEAEGFGGWSGPEVLYLVDEASGVREDIKEAIDGGMAADGCKCVAMANGLRTSGWFFESQTARAAAWTPIQVSSTETPNIAGDGEPIPGLADKVWLDEMKQEYGPEPEKDPVYQVRVLGLFPSQDSTAIVSLSLALEASERHARTPEDGRLVVGLDVGYEGDDETVAQPRRGKKTLPSHAVRKKDGPDVAAWLLDLLFGTPLQPGLAKNGEKPLVIVDKNGYGASAYDQLKRDKRIEVYGVNVSERPTAKAPPGWPEGFNHLRDQLWWGAREWLKDNGTLPPQASKLRADLLAVRLLNPTAAGRMQVESKPEMKKRLGRSPDHGDAFCLSIYTPPPKPQVEVGHVNLHRR